MLSLYEYIYRCSCHTMLDSPTFLYVIILFITIETMYYYKLYLLYLLYTNNIQIMFAATGLSLMPMMVTL